MLERRHGATLVVLTLSTGVCWQISPHTICNHFINSDQRRFSDRGQQTLLKVSTASFCQLFFEMVRLLECYEQR